MSGNHKDENKVYGPDSVRIIALGLEKCETSFPLWSFEKLTATCSRLILMEYSSRFTFQRISCLL